MLVVGSGGNVHDVLLRASDAKRAHTRQCRRSLFFLCFRPSLPRTMWSVWRRRWRDASTVNILRILWLIAVFWFEIGTFHWSVVGCNWPDKGLANVRCLFDFDFPMFNADCYPVRLKKDQPMFCSLLTHRSLTAVHTQIGHGSTHG